jgi:membrane protein required for colicin V production
MIIMIRERKNQVNQNNQKNQWFRQKTKSPMKIIDTLILIALLWFAFQGFRKGFIDGIFSLLAIVIGGWITSSFSDTTHTWLGWEGENSRIIASGATFIAVVIIVFMLGKIVKGLINIVLPNVFDKLAGTLLGGLKVMLFFGIIFYLIASVDVTEKILTQENKNASFFYKPCFSLAAFLMPHIEKLKEIKIEAEE